MKIVFMGTPEIAVFCLKKLLEKNITVSAIVTSPDKPSGRGKKIKHSAVKKYALENNLNIFQPKNLKNTEFINELNFLEPDLIVVVAFRMLPKQVWKIPKKGTINLHASLLPDYRGAAPINWAIINGEKQTGVTTFFIDEKIDTGKIILQKKINIGFDDTAGILHDKIAEKGSDLLLETIYLIEKDEYKVLNQEKLIDKNKQLKRAPKIYKEDCRIDWKNKPENIYNFIRGMSPFPGAWTILKCDNIEKNVKIYFSTFVNQKHNLNNGQIIITKKDLKVAVNEGFIFVKDLKIQGKRRMKATDFVQGISNKNCIFI